MLRNLSSSLDLDRWHRVKDGVDYFVDCFVDHFLNRFLDPFFYHYGRGSTPILLKEGWDAVYQY